MTRILLLLCLTACATPVHAQLVVHGTKQARRLDRRLSRPIQLGLGAMAVHDFATALRKEIGFHVVVDRIAIEEDVSVSNITVNASLRKTSLRHALDDILTPQGLVWQSNDGTIEITSPEDAAMLPRVYDVSRLVRKKHRVKDLDTIVQSISWHVEPSAWPEPGPDITPLALPNATVIVISQNESVHNEIRRFLQSLRRANRR